MTLSAEVAAWADALAAALPPALSDRAEAFAAAVSTGYRERTAPDDAAFDLASVASLEDEAAAPATTVDSGQARWPGAAEGAAELRLSGQRLAVFPGVGSLPGSFRVRRVGAVPVELSALLPVIESFGLVVIEAVPQWIDLLGRGASRWHVDDISMRMRAAPAGLAAGAAATGLDLGSVGPLMIDALSACAASAADVDSLNRLVLNARLGWRQVMLLRAYRRYLSQTRPRWTPEALNDALAAYPRVSAALDAYITARLDPTAERTQRAVEEARRSVVDRLADVSHLEQDQILRRFLALVDATVRTNAFVVPRPFGPGRAVAIQIDSGRVPGSRPGGAGLDSRPGGAVLDSRPGGAVPLLRLETFVHGPEVEGIHLRAGLIARGGLRWSERPDDVRTEVLGLAQAQVKKNAIIVPTGAKGGFVARRAGDRAAPTPPGAVRAAYEIFVGALLDLTDNVVAGRVEHPPGVVAGSDDPYLVVAADKGTAAFSDVANTISQRRSFWLGDAFASGGSHGYDHKALGITARGAWVAVRRHFHQLGVDPQSEPVRVVGVGDMSGDVFGNGMLMSESLRLVAAFDHRHVFVDPDPDPGSSFVERRRLAGQAGSSWDDYDRSVLSAGGGVWSRDAKRIELSVEARRALGVEASVLTPPELISSILAAPVDLLWFGGIGTFVRDPDESDADVGDRGNDAVRITSNELRARVVAEGGNLGVTQRARIRYSRRGGRINADFIDNAAGVAISDREVNLKILLAVAMEDGLLAADDRDQLLVEATEEVVAAVLHQVDNSVVALSREVAASASQIGAYEALTASLEQSGQMDRAAESLPDAEELAERRAAGAGLIRPELAVLLAYAKSAMVADLEASTLPADAALLDSVVPYFPGTIRARFASLVPQHRLYPQLVATDVSGEVVDQMGITWAHETAAALHRPMADVAAAFWAARQVLGAGSRWEELAASTAGVFAPGADLDVEAHQVVSSTVEVVTRRYLARPGPVRPSAHLGDDRDVASFLAAAPLGGAARAERDRLVALGADPSVAADLAGWSAAADAADVAAVVRRCRIEPDAVVTVLAALDDAGGTQVLIRAARQAGEDGGRWAAWQADALQTDVRDWRARAAGDLLAGPRDASGAVETLSQHRAEGAFTPVVDLAGRLGHGDDLTIVALAVRALPELT